MWHPKKKRRTSLISLLTLVLFQMLGFSSSGQSGDTIHANIDVDSAFSIVQLNASNPAFIILDVRSLTEYNIYHLWNGVLLDYNSPSFDSMLNTLDKNKTYLIHCASGGRSANAFNLMKTRKFKTLYNMLGGITSWNSHGYPVTDSIRPVLMSVSDTFFQFDSIYIGQSDTIPVTITNFGNGSLKLNSLTGLSGVDFITDFVSGIEISGLYDYTFNIIYKPKDEFPDSVVISLQSNGGEQHFVLMGKSKTSSLEELRKEQISIFPNPSTGIFYLKGKDIQLIEVYTMTGQKLLLNKMILPQNDLLKLDLSEIGRGLYLVNIKNAEYARIVRVILN